MATKMKSRPARWNEALAAARSAYEALEQALAELDEVRQEYADWRDGLPDNLQQSALGEKLNTVADMDFEAGSLLSEVDNALGEAEGADLPLGFGRD